MEYKYPESDQSMMVWYHRERTGPNFFRVYYKQGCCIRYTPKDVGRVFGCAKFTPGVNKLRDWCYQMVDKFGSTKDKEDEGYLKYVEKNGFGPEAHSEEEDVHDGTKDTKMVI